MGIPLPDGSGGGGENRIGPFLWVSPSPIAFGSVANGVTKNVLVTLRCSGNLVPPIKVQSIALNGSASFGLNGVPALPLSIPLNGTATFNVSVFNAAAVGLIAGNLVVTADDGVHTVPLSANIVVGVPLETTPPTVSFPIPNKVGTYDPAQGQALGIKNVTGSDIHISGITFDSAQFFISSLITFPITIAPAATYNIPFGGVFFFPTNIGVINGSMSIASDSGFSPLVVPMQGTAVLLIPVSILQNATRGIIISFMVDAPLYSALKLLDVTNKDSELDCVLVPNGTIWSSAGNEKTLERIQIFYENIGLCNTLEVIVSAFRPQPDGSDNYDLSTDIIQIGSIAADGSVRSAFADVGMTGEIITIQITRKANGGPCSLIGYTPHFADKGEKVEGT